jgi:molybdenum cofactor cytidylyltransferase
VEGVAAIVFAAGSSSRMGFNKLTADLCGAPVLGHVMLKVASIEGFHARVLVVGFEHEKVLSAVGEYGLDAFRVVVNREYFKGLSSSMRLGLEAAGPSAAYMFIHGDMPFVRRGTMERLLGEFSERRPLILAPTHRGRRGLPVIVDARLRRDLMEVAGDIGARAVFGKYAGDLALVEVDDEFILFDIDTPSDLDAARRLCRALQGEEALGL